MTEPMPDDRTDQSQASHEIDLGALTPEDLEQDASNRHPERTVHLDQRPVAAADLRSTADAREDDGDARPAGSSGRF